MGVAIGASAAAFGASSIGEANAVGAARGPTPGARSRGARRATDPWLARNTGREPDTKSVGKPDAANPHQCGV